MNPELACPHCGSTKTIFPGQGRGELECLCGKVWWPNYIPVAKAYMALCRGTQWKRCAKCRDIKLKSSFPGNGKYCERCST